MSARPLSRLPSPLSGIAAAALALYSLPGISAEPTQVAQALTDITVEGHHAPDFKPEKVSSSKFTAPLVDTPRSVTVINQEVLTSTAATSLQDALRNVPGITFAAGEGGQPIADRPIIRGFNSASNLFVDGVRDIGTQNREVFALEAVEVIQGADSVYAGRGSGGGSINLVSKLPTARAMTSGTLMMGSDDTLRGTVDQNWVVGENTAVRVNAMGNKGNTPGRDKAVNYEKWGIAPSITVGLNQATRLTASYYHLTDNGMPDYSIPYDQATGLPVTETLGVDRNSFYGLAGRDFRRATTDIGTLIAERDLSNGTTLRNVTRYGTSMNSYVVTNPDDSKGNVANGELWRGTKQRYSETDTFANQTDLRGSFNTAALQHTFNIGLEYGRESRMQDGWTVASAAGTSNNCSGPDRDALFANGDCTSLFTPNPNDTWLGTITRNNNPTHYRTQSTGLYAFDSITFNPQWQAHVGLRYDSYETQVRKPSDPRVNGVSRDSFINYQAGLVFKPIDIGSIYLSYSTSSTPPSLAGGDEDAPNAGSPADCTSRCTRSNLDLKPEETRNIELGTKWELFQRRLLVSAAVFDMERKNAQIETAPDTFAQVGKTRVRGAELSFAGQITEVWKLFGGYSYLDSELERGAFNNLAVGQPLPNTPENSFSLFTSVDIVPQLTVGGGAYYVSRVFGNTATTPQKQIPDYWRFDAMAAYKVSTNYSVQVNLQNLTDEVYYTKAYSNHYASLGTGRQLLVSVNMNF
ncbi:TonB-dependent siderophore receptor [Sinimarinibacterium sp. NLF-5-8]|uniref:TonB-dependent receptor n=1 Tax=Sinimarinibacterium sp. NLF-5-8 TaxID=2698684 RepID=UPI00137BAACD|nr:TonB-dependent siderophore receptor [Sinimarinibacterium sp. NLF-5-8]QHS11073.1 TonB-dependent siderophore receptor [Sinimarinibacterium sp. NLF-5-8]